MSPSPAKNSMTESPSLRARFSERLLEPIRRTAAHTMVGESLRAKAARGGIWLGGGSFVEQVSRFSRNMILARLLAPGAFGAMAIVMSSASLVSALSDVGVMPAIIHNPRGGDRTYLNAAWWVGTARAVFMYALVFISAPFISHFYANPELTALTRVCLLSMLFDGLLSPRAKLAHKEMKFGRWAFITNGGGICGVIVTVALSFVLKDVWALAVGYCSESVFRCLFSYIIYPGAPDFRWDRDAFREILTYSKGMLGLSLLNLVFARTDIFVLGKFVTPAELGIYALAVNLVQTPASFLITVLSQTTLPPLSQVQSDLVRMNRILMEVTSWIILLGLPVVAAVWICGPSLLSIFYGHRYSVQSASMALTLATIVAFLNTLNSLITNVFFAAGKPALHRRAVAASAIVMMIAIYPAFKLLGTGGGQLAAVAAIGASYILQILRVHKVTHLNLWRYGRAFGPALLAAGSILLAGTLMRLVGLSAKPGPNVLTMLAVCLVVYLAYLPALMKTRFLTLSGPTRP